MSPSFTLLKLTLLINLLGLFAYLVHDRPMLLAVIILFAMPYSISARPHLFGNIQEVR